MSDCAETMDHAPEDLGGHPLFPRPEGETGPDPRRFDLIHIERWLPDGTKEICPFPFRGSELRSWKQVLELFGGECTYQLKAQCATSYRWQGSTERLTFGYPPRKPFLEGPPAPPPPPPPQTAASVQVLPPPAQTPVPSQSIDAGVGVLGLLGAIMQAQANKDAVVMKSLLERGAQQPQAPAIDQTIISTVVKALVDRGAHAQGPSPLEMLREIRPLLGGGGGANELLKGIEIGRGLVPALGAPQEEDLTSMLGGILKLIAPAQKSTEPATPLASPPAAVPPPWAYMPYGWTPPAGATAAQMLSVALTDPTMRERLRGLLQEIAPQSPAPQQPAPPAVAPAVVARAVSLAECQAPMVPTAIPADEPMEVREATQADLIGLFSTLLPADACATLFQKKENT